MIEVTRMEKTYGDIEQALARVDAVRAGSDRLLAAWAIDGGESADDVMVGDCIVMAAYNACCGMADGHDREDLLGAVVAAMDGWLTSLADIVQVTARLLAGGGGGFGDGALLPRARHSSLTRK